MKITSALALAVSFATTFGCGGSSTQSHAQEAEQPIGLTPSPPSSDSPTSDTPGPTEVAAPTSDAPSSSDDSTAPTTAATAGDVSVGQHAPDLVVDALGSAKIQKMSALAGKTVVVHFWASWCTPCKKEMADLDALAAKHKKNLVVIGVSVDDDKKTADAFLKANKIKFANGYDGGKATAKAWGLSTMPTTFVVDKKGNLATILQGAHPDDVTSIAKAL